MLLLPVLRNRIRSELEKPDQDQNEKQEVVEAHRGFSL